MSHNGIVGTWKTNKKPVKYGKYLVCRKDGKIHFEKWNNTGWAYNNNSIIAWAEILNPIDLQNWQEDFSHENGQYQSKCMNCGNLFIGHKRRFVCRICHTAIK